MIYQIPQTRGAAKAPLSSEQRQKLAAMARYAWIEIGPDQSFDDWRHEECLREVGKAGLTKCHNEDYNPLKARWLYVTGRTTAAYKAALKHVTEPREWALFQLLKACQEAADVMPKALQYAAGFLLNKRHVAIEDADDKAIWHAVFVIRNKASALRGTRKPRKKIASSIDLASRTQAPTRHVKGPF